MQQYEHVMDGLCVWYQYIATYRFGGNISLYLAQQREVLVKKFTLNYPGGAVGFLEDYELAYMNIDYVLKEHPDPEM